MSRMSGNRRSFSDGFGDRPEVLDSELSDPRVGLVNLADVMLVFACGLMVALVAAWGAQIPNMEEMEATDWTEISSDQVSEIRDELQEGSGTGYRALGTIYEDPTTGQMYMLTDEYSENSIIEEEEDSLVGETNEDDAAATGESAS